MSKFEPRDGRPGIAHVNATLITKGSLILGQSVSQQRILFKIELTGGTWLIDGMSSASSLLFQFQVWDLCLETLHRAPPCGQKRKQLLSGSWWFASSSLIGWGKGEASLILKVHRSYPFLPWSLMIMSIICIWIPSSSCFLVLSFYLLLPVCSPICPWYAALLPGMFFLVTFLLSDDSN